MNDEQLGGLVRDLIKVFGMFLATKAAMSGHEAELFAGGLIMLTGSLLSFLRNRLSAMVKIVAKQPEVEKVVLNDPIAPPAFPEHNVVGSDENIREVLTNPNP